MKAEHVSWYSRRIEQETLLVNDIYERLRLRSFLTEEEVAELMNSNYRTNGYVRQLKELVEFDMAGWRYRLFHRRKNKP